MEQTVIQSPMGPLTLFAEENRLTALTFGDFGGYDHLPLFEEARRQLEEYFAGTRQNFDLSLDPGGTDFQRRVWRALTKIPYGKAISYGELARWADCPKGFRAVGQANGKNPLPIIIPCHRVIGADGSLGGYSEGLDRKRFLLDLEGIQYREAKKKGSA